MIQHHINKEMCAVFYPTPVNVFLPCVGSKIMEYLWTFDGIPLKNFASVFRHLIELFRNVQM
jgi:hypothetical protein